MDRRKFLTNSALVAVGTAAPAAALAKTQQDTDRDRMVRVIEQLEAWQDWEASSVVAAKAFAAYQMRKALGLELPDPETAQMHVDYQKGNFERYRRTVWFERDCEAGKHCEIAVMERSL